MADMRELRDEERYWARLLREANARGQAGRSFARCLGSVRAEIACREATCSCDYHDSDRVKVRGR